MLIKPLDSQYTPEKSINQLNYISHNAFMQNKLTLNNVHLILDGFWKTDILFFHCGKN